LLVSLGRGKRNQLLSRLYVAIEISDREIEVLLQFTRCRVIARKEFLKDFEDFTKLREKSHCEEVPLGKIITETDLAAGEGLHSTLKRCKPNGMKFQTTRQPNFSNDRPAG
jgi:hypothetical protein